MENKNQKVTPIVQDIVGCKWSLSVLEALDRGVYRPGRLVKEIEGISTKVLNERIKKLLNYKIIKRVDHREIPPKVEYKLTDFGFKFMRIINEIKAVENEFNEDAS